MKKRNEKSLTKQEFETLQKEIENLTEIIPLRELMANQKKTNFNHESRKHKSVVKKTKI